MSKLSAIFKSTVAAGYGWMRQHKILTVALAGATFGGGGAALMHYLDNATPDPALRNQEWAMLRADIDQAMATSKEFRAVSGLKELLKTHPEKVTITVDGKKMDENLETLSAKLYKEEEKLGQDFSFAAVHISLADMAAIRQELEGKLYIWSFKLDLDGDPSNRVIRSCQKYVLSEKNLFWPDRTEELRQCIDNASSTQGITKVMAWAAALFFAGCGIGGARELYLEDEKEKKRLAREEKRRLAAQALAPDPLVLTAPTTVSAPLKLRLKPKLP